MADGNIRQFDAGDGGLRTSTQAISAFENLARTQVVALNDAGNAIGGGLRAIGQPIEEAHDRYVTQKEISGGAATGSVFLQNQDAAWNELAKSANANDATIAPKFLGKLEEDLAAFELKFETDKGRAWAQSYVQRVRQHFYEKTSADVASRARLAVTQNFNQTINSAIQAVRDDPSSSNTYLGMVDDAVAAMVESSVGIDNVDAAQLQTTMSDQAKGEIAKAAMFGRAEQNPEQFLKDFDAGVFDGELIYLSQAEQAAVRANGEVQKNVKEQEAAATATAVNKANDAAVEKAKVSVVSNALSGKPGSLEALTNEITRMPGVKLEDLSTTYNAVKTIYKDQATGAVFQNVPEVISDFRSRAWLPIGHPQRLTMKELELAVIDHEIDGDARTLFARALNNEDEGYRADQTYLQAELGSYKQYFTGDSGPFGGSDPEGERRYAQFQQDMQKLFDDGIRRNIPAQDLLDRTNKNYILGPNSARLAPYMTGFDPSNFTPIVPEVYSPGESAATTFGRSGKDANSLGNQDDINTFNADTAGFFKLPNEAPVKYDPAKGVGIDEILKASGF